jgi:type I restriction enzyme S subunit
MNTIKGWETKRFDEIGMIFSGSTPSTSIRSFWDGEIVWVTPNDLSKLNTPYLCDSGKRITEKGLNGCSTHLLPAGSLVMSSRAPIGYVALPTVRFCTNQGCKTIKLRSAFHPEFTYYNVLFNIDKVKNLGEGTTFAEISKTALSTVELSFPTSLHEQAKIAEVLSTVDRAIEQTEALIAKQQRIKTGLIQDLLTRGVDEHGNLRSEQTHEFKDSKTPLGRIPVEWGVTDWGSVGYWKGGSTPSKGDPKNWLDGRNLWVSPKDIRAAILDTTEDLLTDRALTVSKLHVFQAGSIFTVFRSGILKHTIPISTCSKAFSVNQDIKVLIPKSDTNIKFLKHLLSYCSPDILRMAVKAGTTVESIDRLVFELMKIPRPDLLEQARISVVLDQQESMSITLKNELLKLRSLKIALMQDLLTGKKRVTALLTQVNENNNGKGVD